MPLSLARDLQIRAKMDEICTQCADFLARPRACLEISMVQGGLVYVEVNEKALCVYICFEMLVSVAATLLVLV